MAYRQCFVPTCKNDTKNCPNKMFVRIREDLREKWCHDAKAEYFKVYTMYCCEDHLEPKEDLINYYKYKLMNEEPKLKPSALLRSIAQDTSENLTELQKLLSPHTSTSNPRQTCTNIPVKTKYDNVNMANTTPYSVVLSKFTPSLVEPPEELVIKTEKLPEELVIKTEDSEGEETADVTPQDTELPQPSTSSNDNPYLSPKEVEPQEHSSSSVRVSVLADNNTLTDKKAIKMKKMAERLQLQRKQIKMLNQKCRRLQDRVNMYKNLVDELRNKNLVHDEGAILLEKFKRRPT